MAFVNEHISDADVEKYGLKDIDANFLVGGSKRRDWTIDRERDIYLRQVASGREDQSEKSTWTFYWRGSPLILTRVTLGVGAERGGDGLRHSSSRIKNFSIPLFLREREQEIKRDLCAAFNAYGGGGVFSSATDYVHDLEFDSVE